MGSKKWLPGNGVLVILFIFFAHGHVSLGICSSSSAVTVTVLCIPQPVCSCRWEQNYNAYQRHQYEKGLIRFLGPSWTSTFRTDLDQTSLARVIIDPLAAPLVVIDVRPTHACLPTRWESLREKDDMLNDSGTDSGTSITVHARCQQSTQFRVDEIRDVLALTRSSSTKLKMSAVGFFLGKGSGAVIDGFFGCTCHDELLAGGLITAGQVTEALLFQLSPLAGGVGLIEVFRMDSTVGFDHVGVRPFRDSDYHKYYLFVVCDMQVVERPDRGAARRHRTFELWIM
ncbi:hypothetical protein CY34DRAFT_106728 [Suillus luteus UH-Slu-Lm8-n1]|uniref:Uncharacterized protein n=1 Tax=Suillus luteus UH-Slu-Lm8-n1 TaxID=930992 RepID=A0A0D0BHS0_9AGAM|nr:hypothetical protein CY34DRAFT_106728 [Suillus luteus UH-Slu-Lm8-n1]